MHSFCKLKKLCSKKLYHVHEFQPCLHDMQHDQTQEQNDGVFSGSTLAYESSAEPLSKFKYATRTNDGGKESY